MRWRGWMLDDCLVLTCVVSGENVGSFPRLEADVVCEFWMPCFILEIQAKSSSPCRWGCYRCGCSRVKSDCLKDHPSGRKSSERTSILLKGLLSR